MRDGNTTRWVKAVGGWAWALLLAGCLGAAPLAPERFALRVGSHDLVLPYQGSHPLVGSQPQVERVVIAIHSYSYLPQEAYNAVVIAAGAHAGPADAVAIFAPQFLESSEVPSSVGDDFLYWNGFPFRGTSNARYGPTAERVSVSIFAVLDRLLATVTDPSLFPNLKTVVLVGHSAGGQAVNRYAVAGRFESTVDSARRLHFRYIVMAPSSYLYFSPERDPDANGVFEVPASGAISGCGDYDEWAYGLDDLWSYPAATGEAVMRAQYPTRFVFYLVGEDDNDPDDASLGTGCQSMLQGPHRLARAQIYFNHLLDVFGPELRRFQSLDVVPGVGHSYTGQLNSAAGRRYLFDADVSDGDGDGQTDWAEWQAGTDPEDAFDRFAMSWAATTDPSGVRLTWPVVSGRRYGILGNADLVSPFVEMEAIRWPGNSGEASWALTLPSSVPFLKIQVELE